MEERNKPGTAKVGTRSKAQNCKRGDLLGFVTLQLIAKYEKNEGWTLGRFLKKPEKIQNEIFEQCHSAEKCKRRDPLGFLDIHCVAKYRNKRRGDSSVQSKKIEKSRIFAEKKSE